MTVNGSVQAITVEPRMTLLDALRDELRLTGPKKASDRGECGACTVLIEGRRVLSCITLALMHDKQLIVTIVRLEHDARLYTVPVIFIHHFDFQRGICTSREIMSSGALIY